MEEEILNSIRDRNPNRLVFLQTERGALLRGIRELLDVFSEALGADHPEIVKTRAVLVTAF